ncbi:MAG: carboxylesterase family protein [Deltaproteobacteria bacterium]|nr:carboxylesterase family protein [Deltaproteobacteria bacterium]
MGDVGIDTSPLVDSGVDASWTPPTPGVALTDLGEIRGVGEDDVFIFRGIPFAAPPVGDLRWRPPEDPGAFSEPFMADRFGPICMRSTATGTEGSEDCLTLNVWTPSSPAAAPRPVLLNIHGGGNLVGSGSGPGMDGRVLVARHDVVYVTLNYRLGPFGFFAHDAFEAENEHGASGNYGLMDQLAALRWLQRNVTAFGGDPSRVLVFGYSAGSSNTCALVASPEAAGLFSTAVLQSGPCAVRTEARMAELATRTTEALGCTGTTDVAACLRASTADAVSQVPGATLSSISNGRADFYTNVDGHVLTEAPLVTFMAGRGNPVSVIGGTTRDENITTVQYFYETPPADDAAYRTVLDNLFGAEHTDTLVGRYPAAAHGTHVQALAALLSDLSMHCPLRRQLRALAAGPSPSVRRYVFAPVGGAGHGADAALPIGQSSNPAWAPVSDTIMGYWTSFAASGDPNGGARPDWPVHDPVTDEYLILSEDPEVARGFHSSECDFWDTAPLGDDPLGG